MNDVTENNLLKLRLDIAYDGSDFSGWAVQPGLRTVQGVLEEALQRALRLSEPPRLFVAGRTDARVHARRQVAHVIIDRDSWSDALTVLRRITAQLDSSVVVKDISEVSMDFDARFSATYRRYSYTIADSLQRWDPLQRTGVLWYKYHLDLDLMNAASERLLGLHDFAAFCKPRPGATTIRELRVLRWERLAQSGYLQGEILADAFCHNMVRAIVGCLLQVGAKRKPVEWISEVLNGKDRAAAAAVAGPEGLVLEEVGYGPEHEWAEQNMRTRARRE